MAILKRKTRLKKQVVKTTPAPKRRTLKKPALPANTWTKVQTAESWLRENRPSH